MADKQEGALVTFYEDVYPYVRGDVVRLTDAEKARVDEQVKKRNLETGYKAGDKRSDVVDTVDGSPEALRQSAAAAQQATARNEIEQSAVLEAQQNAVAEPANVEALGVVGTGDQEVVTGTPSVDVEVANPQEAVDPSSDAGAEVSKVNGKKAK